MTCNTLTNVANVVVYTGRVDSNSNDSNVYVGIEIITDEETLYSRYLTGETVVNNLTNVNDLLIKNGSIIKLIHAQPQYLYLFKSGQIQDVVFNTVNTLIVVNNQLVLQEEAV